MKILYYDCWLVGKKYILKIDQYFYLNNHDRFLLHTSSWYNDSTSSKEFDDVNIITYDICEFENRFINALEKIKPNVIIGFNIESISDRSIILLSKKLSIPFVYLAHGNISNVDRVKKNINQMFRKKLTSRLYRNFKYVIPNYINSKNNLNKINSYFSIIPFILNPGKNIFLGQHNLGEIDPTLSLVYSNKDKNHLNKTKQILNTKIKVVGDPQLSDKELINNNSEKYFLYIDDGYCENGIWTIKDFYTQLDLFRDLSEKLKLKLLVRLHPRNNYSNHIEYFKESNIAISQNSLIEDIFFSEFCINYSSSCINIALLYNKSIYAPLIGPAKFKHLKIHDEKLIKYIIDINQIPYDDINYDNIVKKYVKEELGYTTNINPVHNIYKEVCTIT